MLHSPVSESRLQSQKLSEMFNLLIIPHFLGVSPLLSNSLAKLDLVMVILWINKKITNQLEFRAAVDAAIDNVLELVKQNQLITENTTDPEMVCVFFFSFPFWVVL